jgi:hypothetical protein
MARNNATLVIEGDQNINGFIQSYFNGALSDNDLKKNYVSAYHQNDPAEAKKWEDSKLSILINAKSSQLRMVALETRDSLTELRENDPKAVEIYEKLAGNITNIECAMTQASAIISTLTLEEEEALERAGKFIEARIGSEFNIDLASDIKKQKPPYVVFYGDGHRPTLTNELNATSIVIMPSESSPYFGAVDLPDYIYYADTDKVVAIPLGSKEREAFIKKHIKNEIPAMGIVIPEAPEDSGSCLDKLPPDLRKPRPYELDEIKGWLGL